MYNNTALASVRVADSQLFFLTHLHPQVDGLLNYQLIRLSFPAENAYDSYPRRHGLLLLTTLLAVAACLAATS